MILSCEVTELRLFVYNSNVGASNCKSFSDSCRNYNINKYVGQRSARKMAVILSFVKFTVNLAYQSCVFLFFSSFFVLHVVQIHLRFSSSLSLSFYFFFFFLYVH